MFDPLKEKVKKVFYPSKRPLNTIAQLNSDNLIAVGGADGKVYTFNIPFGKVINTMNAHEDQVTVSLFDTFSVFW